MWTNRNFVSIAEYPRPVGRIHHWRHRLATPQPLSPLVLQKLAALIDQYGVERRDRLATAIREVGIGAFEASLQQIVVLLGHMHLSIDELRALVTYARRTDNRANQTVREQHVVSKVLLKQFCREPVPPQKRGKLQPFDLAKGERTGDPRTPSGAGKVRDFVTKDSAAAEACWWDVENALESVLTALKHSPRLEDPDHVKTIKKAVALHYARSHMVRDLIHAMARERLAALRAAIRDVPTPPGLAERVAAIAGIVEDGTYFRYRVPDLFGRLTHVALARELTILVPPPNKPLLIGDTPAIAWDTATGRLGPRQGVGFNGPTTLVVLPLRRDRLAVLAPMTGMGDNGSCTAAQVDLFNSFQVQQAKHYVFHHPADNFDDFISWIRRGSNTVRR